LIKNSQPFGKKISENRRGDFFDPHCRKSLNFLTPPFFEAPARGNPLEFCDEIWHQKTRIVLLPDGEETMTLAFFVLTQYRRVTDGRTGGRTDTFLSQRPALVKIGRSWNII